MPVPLTARRAALIWVLLTVPVAMSTRAQYGELWTIQGDGSSDHVDLEQAHDIVAVHRCVKAGVPTIYPGPFTPPEADGWEEGSWMPDTNALYGDCDGDGFAEFVSLDPDQSKRELVVWDSRTGAVEAVISYGGVSTEPRLDSVLLIDAESDGISEILVHWSSTSSREQGWTLYGLDVMPRAAHGGVPAAAASHLGVCAPNPFNPMSTVRFELAADGEVSLRVYDTTGRLVRRLVEGRHRQGSHRVRWNARDDRDLEVASGTYFYELTVDGSKIGTSRVVVLE